MLSTKEASEPGPYRTSRTPYLKEIMECLSPDSDVEEVVFEKGAQIGATRLGTNWLGFVIHRAPGPFLYVEPTVEGAKKVSKQRIATMIESTPELAARVAHARSRDSGNTIMMKEFDGGFLMMVGANSGTGFRQVPIRYLFLDDADGYPPYVEDEGDPVELARQRTATFSGNRKIFMVSTPKLRGGRIDQAFLATDQRRYFVPCPSCGEYDWIRWERIKWPESHPEDAALECAACGALTAERMKPQLLAAGRWQPTADSSNPRRRGYHLSALYSPLGWKSWAEAARELHDAKAKGRQAIQAWTNTVLGEGWEEEGQSIEEEGLFARREHYPAEAPLGVLVITAGVDVQDDRLELELVGWGVGEESWGLDYRVLHGPPEQGAVWQQLDEALAARYQREDGALLSVSAVGVDTGYATQQAYEYARLREARGVVALKGMAGGGRALISSPAEKRTGRTKKPVRLFTVGVDEAKGLLYSRLKLTLPGPAYCHFPIHEGYDPEYFAQLAAERRVLRYHKGFPRHEWVKARPRNEALDCRVYAMAVLYVLNPAWTQLARRVGPPKKEALKESESFDPRAARRRIVRGRWPNRWRQW